MVNWFLLNWFGRLKLRAILKSASLIILPPRSHHPAAFARASWQPWNCLVCIRRPAHKRASLSLSPPFPLSLCVLVHTAVLLSFARAFYASFFVCANRNSGLKFRRASCCWDELRRRLCAGSSSPTSKGREEKAHEWAEGQRGTDFDVNSVRRERAERERKV